MVYRRSVSRSSAPMSDEEIEDYRMYILKARESFFERLNEMYDALGP
jgi:hypothetical protein